MTALLALAVPLPAAAQAQQAPPVRTVGGSYVVNLRDVEIDAFADQVAEITGRTIILDPQVSGNVTVASAQPLSAGGVWELFQSTMRVNGFAVLQTGRNWRVVPLSDAAPGAALAAAGADAEDLVTRLVPLQTLPAAEAAEVLEGLVASFGNVAAVSEPNAIVITDYADNVRRLETLVRQLDAGRQGNITAIPVSFAGAGYVAEIVADILGEDARARIAVDARGNALLVRADPATLAEIRRLVDSVDRPGGALPATRVFRLRNTDAEFITDILTGVFGGADRGAVTNPVARSVGANGLDQRIGAGPTSTVGSPVVVDNQGLQPASQALSASSQYAQSQPAQSGGAAGPQGAATRGGASAETLSIQAAPEINAIVIRGLPGMLAEADALINELDTRRPQVMIEAAIVEITGEAAEDLAVQIAAGGNTPTGAAGATSFSALGLPIRSILAALGSPFRNAVPENGLTAGVGITDEFGLLVQALSTSTAANLLSTPSLTTLDNAPAEIVVGQNVPFRTGSFTTAGNTLNPFTTIEREDVGITMRVIPRVYEGDVVRLDISQEVSSLVGSLTGAADLITNRRSIQTSILADTRETVVLGGLISDDYIRSETKVPILGDIPIIGNLFKAQRENRSRRTLFVFLRPTILRERADIIRAASDKYQRIRRLDANNQEDENLLLNPPEPKLPEALDDIY